MNNENLENFPLYQKANEILKLTALIIEIVSDPDSEFEYSNDVEPEMINECISFLAENSVIITSQIAGSFDDIMPYDIKMESACFIRNAALDILTDLGQIEMFGYKDLEYLDVLRNEIDEFRVMFAEWVKTFDPWNYHIDRWGLFNPPGINYDDHDPDDDIPFDADNI